MLNLLIGILSIMKSRVKDILVKNKTLVSNFSYLSLIQIFTLIVPLLTYPYLVSVLGTEIYGKVVLAQAIISFFAVAVNYGFNIIATKEIAQNIDNEKKKRQVVYGVFLIKIIIWITLLLILVIISLFFFRSELVLLVFTYTITFNELLFPQWYFQGIQKMRYVTIFNLVSRSIFLIFIFILIKDKSDYLYVPILNGIGALLAGIVGIYILVVKEKMYFAHPNINYIKYLVKESTPIFTSQIVIITKDKFNYIFIGMFLTLTDIAIYDLAIKLFNLLKMPVIILTDTVYPKVANKFELKFVLRMILLSFIISVISLSFIQIIMPFLVKLLSNGTITDLEPIRLLLISILFFSIGLPLSRNIIIVNGYYQKLLWGMVYTVIFYFLIIGLGYYLNILNSIFFFITTLILVFVFELVYRSIISIIIIRDIKNQIRI